MQGGGYDTYRAAHDILEDALAGVISFSFPPPSAGHATCVVLSSI